MGRASRRSMSNKKNNEESAKGGDIMTTDIIEAIRKNVPVIATAELIADALYSINFRVTEVETMLNSVPEIEDEEYGVTLESRLVALTDNQEAIQEDLKTLSERLNGLIEALQDSVSDL